MSTIPVTDGIVDDLRAPIAITFPDAVDESSLAAATVSLKSFSPPSDPETLIGTLTLASPKEVRFTPAAPLARRKHQFLLSGIKFTDGTAAPAVDLPFRARLVSERRFSTYTNNVVTGGNLFKYTGDTERFIIFSSAGANGTFGDSDDVVARWRERTVQPTQVSTLFYRGPGADGVWFNADDQPDLRNAGVAAIIVSLGSDGLAQKSESFRPGPDEKILTADDVLIDRSIYDRSIAGEERETSFAEGSDNVLGTSDDVLGSCHTIVRNTAKRKVSEKYANPGPDALCYTSDDFVTYDDSSSYNAAGQRTSTSYTFANGDDSDPETVDQGGGSETLTYLANGDLKELVTFDAGPDFLPDTADDYVVTYTVISQGGLQEESYDAGPDHMRDTGDDYRTGKLTYTLEP